MRLLTWNCRRLRKYHSLLLGCDTGLLPLPYVMLQRRLLRQKTELDRKIDVKKVDVFRLQQMHEIFGLFFTENKTDFYRQVRRQFKKGFRVQYAMATETSQGARCSTAIKPAFFCA